MFEFESQFQRMSVVTKDEMNNYVVYCKGAPEVIESLCSPETVSRRYVAVVK